VHAGINSIIMIIIIIILNNIQNYLLSIHYTFSSSWGWMLTRSVYPPVIRIIISAPKICVTNPNTILVRHHLIASSFPTCLGKRKPVILATAKTVYLHRKVPPSRTPSNPRGHPQCKHEWWPAWLFDRILSPA